MASCSVNFARQLGNYNLNLVAWLFHDLVSGLGGPGIQLLYQVVSLNVENLYHL